MLRRCADTARLAKLPVYYREESTMGLFRLLFWIAIIAAAFWLWRRFTRPAPRRPHEHTDNAEPMVRCEHCGVHIPRLHALPKDQHWYCSQAHLEQGPKTGGR
jgi:uncharacterized protein